MKVASLFSGIGAIEQAFLKQNIEHKIVFACDNGERELNYSILGIPSSKLFEERGTPENVKTNFKHRFGVSLEEELLRRIEKDIKEISKNNKKIENFFSIF